MEPGTKSPVFYISCAFKMADDTDKMDANESGSISTAKWLVDRAKQSLKHENVFEAKSWLLTAKTLYPKDFHVQHEAYNIERNTKRVKESAIIFYEMFVQFPSESLLWKDIQNLTVALEGNEEDSTREFLKDMFNCLPQSAQREILLQAAGRYKDCIEKCRMMLLLIRRFPDSVPKNGITLTDMLIDAEGTEYPNNPLNPYRKLLVCDVLPHLFASESIEVEGIRLQESHEAHRPTTISLQTALKWLELSIQFYSFCGTYVSVHNATEMMSPSIHTNSLVNETRDIVNSVREGRGPWYELYQIFCQIAKKCRWNEILKIQDKLDPLVHRSIKERWMCISEVHHYLKKAAKHGAGRDVNEAQEKTGVFYATIIIFFQSVWEYCKVVNKLDCTGNPGIMPSTFLVLIEDMSADKNGNDGWAGGSPSETSSSAPKKKKKRGSTAPLSPSREEQRAKQTTTIIVSKTCGSISSSISDDFVVSVDTWHILNTHVDYKNEFTRVLTEWHIDSWIWMETFKVDRMVYKAKYKKVVDFLKEQKNFLQSDPSPVNQEICGRWSFQLSCCYYYLAEHKNSCTEALDALLMFGKITSTDVKTLKRGLSTMQNNPSRDIMSLCQGNPQGRFLQLIPCSEMEALSFCVRLLITCFKQKISHEGRSGDLVGHMIVLLQCDWPKEERTFYELLERIRSQGGLTYRKFFDYIVNIDILEEFSYLNSEGVLKLELLPKSTSSSRSRTVTRGVNKGAKEDFRSAMEKQVSRCEENIDTILRTFLEEERDAITNIL